MLGGNLNQIIDQVSKEKSIDRSILVEALEQGILTAAKKTFGHTRELEAKYNEEIGLVELMMYMVMDEDGTVQDYQRELPQSTAQFIDAEVQIGEIGRAHV